MAPQAPLSPALGRGTYVLTKIVFLRYLGCIYLVAFLVAAEQNPVLFGEHGLTPARPYMRRVLQQTCGNDWWPCMKVLPSLFWFSDELCSDFLMRVAALAGIGLSTAVVVLGSANTLMMGALWALYMSVVNVGQTWYSFGWESQLLETGFLAIWLCKWTQVVGGRGAGGWAPSRAGRPCAREANLDAAHRFMNPLRRLARCSLALTRRGSSRRLGRWWRGAIAGYSFALCLARASSKSGATSAGATSRAWCIITRRSRSRTLSAGACRGLPTTLADFT